MEIKQLPINFEIHWVENNAESQAYLNSHRDQFKGQCLAVFEWLASGRTLTTREAMNLLDIIDLRRRIKDLRDAGVNIQDKPAGNGRNKYKVYYLNTH